MIAIKQLQEIGVSLEQIGRFGETYQGTDIVEGLNEILIFQEKEISLKLEEYTRKLDRIHLMQHQCNKIQEQVLDFSDAGFVVKDLPERSMVCKEFSGTYTSDIFRDYYRTILDSIEVSGVDIGNICSPPLAVFRTDLQAENITIQIGYQVNSELSITGVDKIIIKAGRYLCDVYKGPHGVMKKEFYDCLYEYIDANNYTIVGDPLKYIISVRFIPTLTIIITLKYKFQFKKYS